MAGGIGSTGPGDSLCSIDVSVLSLYHSPIKAAALESSLPLLAQAPVLLVGTPEGLLAVDCHTYGVKTAILYSAQDHSAWGTIRRHALCSLLACLHGQSDPHSHACAASGSSMQLLVMNTWFRLISDRLISDQESRSACVAHTPAGASTYQTYPLRGPTHSGCHLPRLLSSAVWMMAGGCIRCSFALLAQMQHLIHHTSQPAQ